jgi:transposase
MLIIGCDYHPSVQQIAWVDLETGECGERRLTHCAEAEEFYRELRAKGVRVTVGMEATGHSRWFERLLAELNYELGWVIRHRFEPSGYASRRTIGSMPSIFSS